MFDDNADDDESKPWQGEPEPNEEVLICPVCGAEVDWDETHCTECGSYMRLDSEPESDL